MYERFKNDLKNRLKELQHENSTLVYIFNNYQLKNSENELI